MENPLLLLDQIRTAPTVEAWEYILRLAMHGKLSAYIEAHYGAVEDMVLTLLENSREKALADMRFREALDRAFANLDLSTLTNDNAREAVLRLLQTFRPHAGREQLLTYALNGVRFARFRFESEHEGLSYMDRLAWNALQAYFAVNDEDPRKQPAYKSYVRFLEGSLDVAATRSLACRRLLELGEMDRDSSRWGELVLAHASSLVPAMVEWLFSSSRVDRNTTFEALYQHCTLSANALIAFETAFERLGGSIDHRDFQVVFSFSSGNDLTVHSVARSLLEEASGWKTEGDRFRSEMELTGGRGK